VAFQAAAVVLAGLLAVPAAAQTSQKPRLGTSYISVFGGGARASGNVDPTSGASLGVELRPRLALEGRVHWFNVPGQQAAYATDLGIRYTVAARTFTAPFLSAGVGLYDAYFPRASGTIPSFYRSRMDAEGGGQAFRDVAWTLGGGADLFVTGHVALRPDAVLLMVTTRRDARVVPVYGIHIAYFFESHTSLSRH
jgi:hypothetical protein